MCKEYATDAPRKTSTTILAASPYYWQYKENMYI
jgi:hypothetical protein